MTQSTEESILEDSPSPHKCTSFNVIDILNPTKFNGSSSPNPKDTASSMMTSSHGHSDNDVTGELHLVSSYYYTFFKIWLWYVLPLIAFL